MAASKGCMWLAREQKTHSTERRTLNVGSQNKLEVEYGRFVMIVSQGEDPQTFLIVPLESGDDVEVRTKENLDAQWCAKYPGTFIEVLGRIHPAGRSILVSDINSLDQLTLVPHTKTQKMIKKLDELRSASGWIDYMKRHDTQTRLDYLLSYDATLEKYTRK